MPSPLVQTPDFIVILLMLMPVLADKDKELLLLPLTSSLASDAPLVGACRAQRDRHPRLR
jgi:hypothetical protein